jgi:hypothetical protein
MMVGSEQAFPIFNKRRRALRTYCFERVREEEDEAKSPNRNER